MRLPHATPPLVVPYACHQSSVIARSFTQSSRMPPLPSPDPPPPTTTGGAGDKFLGAALGRGLESYDMPAVRAIMRQASAENFRLTALIDAIVKSAPFQMRRTSEE